MWSGTAGAGAAAFGFAGVTAAMPTPSGDGHRRHTGRVDSALVTDVAFTDTHEFQGARIVRAVVCRAWGPPEALAVEDVPAPAPGAGEVLVRVRACGVNFADALIVQGKYQEKPPLPFTPGMEVAGDVAAVGEGVTGPVSGQRVVSLCTTGGYAEAVAAPAAVTVPIPDAMSWETAAGFTVAYGTAHVALAHRAKLREGETLLVHGAGGGVGLAAVEVGKAMGATVIATAGSEDKRALASAHGADHVIDYRTGGFRDAVKSITGGRGADVVFDPWEATSSPSRCAASHGKAGCWSSASPRGTSPRFRPAWCW